MKEYRVITSPDNQWDNIERHYIMAENIEEATKKARAESKDQYVMEAREIK